MALSDPARPDDSGPHARLDALQGALYDLVLTSVARPCAAEQLPRLRHDAQQAASLAQQLADTALQPATPETFRRPGMNPLATHATPTATTGTGSRSPTPASSSKARRRMLSLADLRELTVNVLQAIAALAPNATGRVVWELD